MLFSNPVPLWVGPGRPVPRKCPRPGREPVCRKPGSSLCLAASRRRSPSLGGGSGSWWLPRKNTWRWRLWPCSLWSRCLKNGKSICFHYIYIILYMNIQYTKYINVNIKSKPVCILGLQVFHSWLIHGLFFLCPPHTFLRKHKGLYLTLLSIFLRISLFLCFVVSTLLE